MPNAAARLDDDYGFGQPAPKNKARRRAATPKSKRKSPARTGKSQSRYIRYAAVGLTAILAGGIVINALALQNSRHPAPLFGKAIELGDQPVLPTAGAGHTDPAGSTAAAALELPIPPVAATPNPTSSSPASTLKTTPTAHDNDSVAAHPHHAALDAAIAARHPKPARDERPGNAGTGNDPIAAMLKTSAPTERPVETSKTILAVQHALMKIGYVVAPDGSYGAATRTAIQAFEREQHLPQTGELSRKLLKQLSAESGIAID